MKRASSPSREPAPASSARTDFIAYAEAKAYRQGSIEVKAQLSDKAAPGVSGNAIAAGSVGLVVDVASGANLDHIISPAAAAAGGG